MVNRSGVGPAFARMRGLVLLVLLAVGAGLLLKHDASQAPSSSPQSLGSAPIRASFARLPISFEPNQGQADSLVKFLAHVNGYGLYLTPSDAVLTLPPQSQKAVQATVEMQLAGANRHAEVDGAEKLPGHSNYFIGNDPSRWLRNIPQFGRVQYRDVYPGIDLAFYGNQSRLEYDFEVSPGSDPRQIQLNFKGAKNVSIANNGDLVLGMDGRELRFQAPHIYQKSASGEQIVAGAFARRGTDGVGFEIGAYDRSRALVIDPILTFSTYLGGVGDESCTVITGAGAGAFVPHCPSVAVSSAAGTIYVAGATTTAVGAGSFAGGTPTTIPPNTNPNPAMVFVSQISTTSSGATLGFVTYIGGTGTQYPIGIGVDSGFNVYVAGTTNASNYPTTPSAFQQSPAAPGTHVFVSKLDISGSQNLYSSYLSGSGTDIASNMTVDSQGRVYVIGTTNSADFPTTLGAIQPHPNATNQFFFSKLNTALNTTSSLRYSTYIGGSTPAAGATTGVVMGGAVVVDSNFNVYLAGGTNFTDMGSPNPWILNAFQAGEQGGIDVWAAKLNAPPANTEQFTIAYATYLGGSGDDIAYGVATDGTSTYITGSTTSTNITPPTTTTPFQTANAGGTGTDAFVAKFGVPAVSGTTQGTVPLDYFSYLGGTGQDVGLGIVADTLGNATLTGLTSSTDFHTATPFQSASGGGTDAFVSRLVTTVTSTSTNTSTSSYLGGAGTDIGTSIALDSALNTYITGETSSTGGVGTGNFPTCPTPASPGCGPNSIPPLAAGTGLSGPTDAFVTELGPNTSGLSLPNPTPADASTTPGCNVANPTVSPSPAGVGSSVRFTYYIYNIADPVSGVTFTDSPGINTSQVTAAISGTSGGTCSSTTGSLVCSLGTVPSSTISTLSTDNVCGRSTSVTSAATVTVTVTASNTVQQGASTIGNSASLSFPGGSTAAIKASVPLNDFSVSASLAAPSTSSTIPSGGQVNYSVTVAATGSGFAEQVSLACGAGLPSGSNCTFTNNPISTLANGPQSRALAISTTARVTTTASLLRRGLGLAMWLPILGVGLIGTGVSRKRRTLIGSFFALMLGLALLQAGCGGSHSPTTTTSGTPAGTYTIPVNATSGSAVRTTTVQFTVE